MENALQISRDFVRTFVIFPALLHASLTKTIAPFYILFHATCPNLHGFVIRMYLMDRDEMPLPQSAKMLIFYTEAFPSSQNLLRNHEYVHRLKAANGQQSKNVKSKIKYYEWDYTKPLGPTPQSKSIGENQRFWKPIESVVSRRFEKVILPKIG